MGYSILTLEGLPEECSDLADNMAEIYEVSRKAKDIIARLNALSRRNEGEHFRSLSLQALASKVLSVARPAQPPHVETTFTLTSPWKNRPRMPNLNKYSSLRQVGLSQPCYALLTKLLVKSRTWRFDPCARRPPSALRSSST